MRRWRWVKWKNGSRKWAETQIKDSWLPGLPLFQVPARSIATALRKNPPLNTLTLLSVINLWCSVHCRSSFVMECWHFYSTMDFSPCDCWTVVQNRTSKKEPLVFDSEQWCWEKNKKKQKNIFLCHWNISTWCHIMRIWTVILVRDTNKKQDSTVMLAALWGYIKVLQGVFNCFWITDPSLWPTYANKTIGEKIGYFNLVNVVILNACQGSDESLN